MGPEAPRSSRVSQMVGKFFWGCSVLLWDGCVALWSRLALCLHGNSKPQPSGAVCSCEGLSHQNVSEAAFSSILILNFPFQLSLPDCFLKYHCGFTAWSRSGSAVWQEFLNLPFILENSLWFVFRTAEPPLDNISFALFASACVTDFKHAW